MKNGSTKTYPSWRFRFKRNGGEYRINTKQSDKGTAIELEADMRTRIARSEPVSTTHATYPNSQFKSQFLDASSVGGKATDSRVLPRPHEGVTGLPCPRECHPDLINEFLIESYVLRGPKSPTATLNRDYLFAASLAPRPRMEIDSPRTQDSTATVREFAGLRTAPWSGATVFGCLR
jgi:hypothetical protein